MPQLSKPRVVHSAHSLPQRILKLFNFNLSVRRKPTACLELNYLRIIKLSQNPLSWIIILMRIKLHARRLYSLVGIKINILCAKRLYSLVLIQINTMRTPNNAIAR